MVGVTCEKCGATYRFDDADVPPSGKIIKCARCGQAITVMPTGADAMGMTTPASGAPARTVFGLGPLQTPSKGAPAPRAKTPALGVKVPAPAARPKPSPSPASDEGGLAWDDLSASDLVNLEESRYGAGADLAGVPVPKRASPLARKEDEELDLVAPVGPTSKKQQGAGREAPDLLAPVGPRPTQKGTPPAASRTAVPAAKQVTRPPREISDLPAPVGPTSKRNAPADPQIPDLLAPVGPLPKKSVPDLLTPVGPTSKKNAPAAAAPAATPMPSAGDTEPPPVAPQARRPPGDVPDLPAPVGPLPTKQLPDLLTPVGPVPTKGIDLPAPKGFFDDGLQPRLPGNAAVGLPAPKGFFDDGMQPKREANPAELELQLSPSDAAAGRTVAGTGKPAPAPASRVASGPDPARAATAPAADKPSFDLHDSIELGDSFLSPPTGPQRPFGLDTGDLEFTMERTGNSAPSVPIDLEELGPSGPAPAAPSDSGLLSLGGPDAIELDLAGPEPAALPASSVVTFGRPAGPQQTKHGTQGVPLARGKADPFAPENVGRPTMEIGLDLDRPGGGERAPALSAPGRPVELATPVRRAPVRKAEEAAPARTGRKRTILLASVLGVVALGAGGWFAWTTWQGSQTRKDSASRGLKKAETLLSDDSAGHWERAASEAQRVLGGDSNNDEALAVVAEANFAAVLDESLDVAARTEKGDKAIEKLRKSHGKGPHAAKAEALRAVLSTSFEAAVKKLDPLRDGDARLYLGWALAAHEQHEKAAQAFSAALARKPKRIPAQYGLGLAKLELGARDEARKAFQAAIDESRDRFKRDHLGALIGLAQLVPVGEREGRYQELLNRPDLAKEPPRAVSRLKALAADEAMRAGRLDQGKALYEEARSLDQLNLRAQVGLAVFSARTGDLAGARKRLGEVLSVAPGHIEAALALGDVAIAEGKPDEAMKLADGLLARTPPVANPLMIARVHLTRAAAFEGSADRAVQEKAETEYRESMKRAEPGDFTAAVRLSILLTRLGKAKDAVEVLEPVKAAAQKDPDLSITLGGAYLSAGNGAAAAEAFQSALHRRPDDLEARFQLGQAQFLQGKHEQAIETLRGAMDKDASREDIGLALARMLAARGRIKDAALVFDKLLAGKPSLTARARAGRFFAREGMHDKAMLQGEAIRGESPRHPTGLFLLGEKLLAEQKFEEAQKAYRDATRLEPEAQYFEALARAAERLGQLDEALRQFGRASEVDPAYLAPRLGRARIRLLRREYSLAIDELKAAQELDPNGASVMRDLGRAYLAMRDVKTATPYLERATHAAPDDPEAHFALGQAYFDSDRARDAAAQLGRAVQLAREDAPWRAEAYRTLGYAARSAGNNRGAATAWRTYLEIDQKDSAHRRDVQRLLLRLEAH